MQVCIDDFPAALEELALALQDPNVLFIGMDEEMSGISIPGQPRETFEQLPEERYAMMRTVASTYHIIQFGICIMTLRTEGKRQYLEAKPFNFYVWPDRTKSKIVTLETMAIAFNAQHNMDFNKWLYEGIPYVNKKQEEEIFAAVAKLEDQAEDTKEAMLAVDKATDVTLLDKTMERVDQWYGNAELKLNPLKITGLNGFLRKVLRQKISLKYGKQIHGDSRGEGSRRYLVLSIVSVSDYDAAQAERVQVAVEQARARIGMRRVFTLLSRSRKPIVVQNGMYDFMFMYSHFEGDLPESYEEFKSSIHKLFPFIYDTKILMDLPEIDRVVYTPPDPVPIDTTTTTTTEAKTDSDGDVIVKDVAQKSVFTQKYRFTSKGLGRVVEAFEQELTLIALYPDKYPLESRPLELRFANGFRDYAPDSDDDGAFHQAGYDAYATCFIFAHMLHNVLDITDSKALETHKCVNKLNFFRSFYRLHLVEGEPDRFANPDTPFVVVSQIGDRDEVRKAIQKEVSTGYYTQYIGHDQVIVTGTEEVRPTIKRLLNEAAKGWENATIVDYDEYAKQRLESFYARKRRRVQVEQEEN